MKLILSLSLRNLFRQKRRNIFLGMAIAFGMMILVVSNSFSHGLSDTLLNRMVVFMMGHMSVFGMEESNKNKIIIRDKDRFIRIIKSNMLDTKEVIEAVGVFCRVIGKSKGDNAVIVGVPDNDKEFFDYIGQNYVDGSLKDFTSGALENPVVLYSDKSKTLGVKHKDFLSVRMRTVNGQEQTVRLTVATIIRSNNMFEGMVIFVPLKMLKPLVGLKPHETMSLHINFNRINNPDFTIQEANKLHKLLEPGVAVVMGGASFKKKTVGASSLGFSVDKNAGAIMKKYITIVAGAVPEDTSDKKALINKRLADELSLKPGDAFEYSYKNKFEGLTTKNMYVISGIFKSDKMPDKNIMLLNEKTFYKMYLHNLPDDARKDKNTFVPDKKSALFAMFSPEWKLLPRTSTHDDMEKKLSTMTKTKWKGPWIDVRTMYENADFILKLEFALNLVALIAVLILFLIILIGVLNTLRMTIRERTREIGTIRAIGMQKTDVKNLFITETVFLTAISCLFGIIVSFILMGILGLFTIQTESVLSILLVKRHLYFLPTAKSIIGNFILIMIMSGVTAYFPARRAANLSAVEALRHFE